MTNKIIEEGKTSAILSYITIIGAIVAIFLNNDKKNKFASFHNRQGLGLNLTYMICGYFIGQFNSWSASVGFWICFGILFVYGITLAISGKTQEIPVVGPLFQKWFSSIGK